MIKRLIAFLYMLVFFVTGINIGEHRMFARSFSAVFSADEPSCIYVPDDNTWGNGANSCTVVKLSGGVVLCTFAVYDSGKTSSPSGYRIMKSLDNGKTWAMTEKVCETVDTTTEAQWSPCLSVLPDALGELPAGTVLLAGTSICPSHKDKSYVTLYISTDDGDSFTQTAPIAEGGGIDSGVWEPFFIFDGGELYCFYSDETDGTHSQRIVYKKSSDCVNWSDAYEFAAFDNTDCRPGMPVITKMGNGKYFAVYEIVDGPDGGAPLYYKISDSLDNWGASDMGTRLRTVNSAGCGSAPMCAWTPAGGKNGTLFVTAKYSGGNNEMIVSHDFGKHFVLIDDPMPHSDISGMGYKSGMCVDGQTGNVLYVNSVDNINGKSKIAFCEIEVRSLIPDLDMIC